MEVSLKSKMGGVHRINFLHKIKLNLLSDTFKIGVLTLESLDTDGVEKFIS